MKFLKLSRSIASRAINHELSLPAEQVDAERRSFLKQFSGAGVSATAALLFGDVALNAQTTNGNLDTINQILSY